MSEILYKANPAMFRSRPIGFILSVCLIPFGVGLLILLVWFLKCKATTLTLTADRCVVQRGLLSKVINDVRVADIRNIRTIQGLFQRMFGVGTIVIATAGTADAEITVSGLPNPDKIKSIIQSNQ